MWFSLTCFFIISVSFTHHVVTFEGYVNWYRGTDANQQKDLNGKFSEYLVSVCYKKMEQHISHWAAVGMNQEFYVVFESPTKAGFYLPN